MNNNNIYDTIGKNIKKYRKANNLTEQLASRANLSYGFIKNLEAKSVHATISIETLALLADCLGVKLSDLLEESN
mgnify:CR=1 FL=1